MTHTIFHQFGLCQYYCGKMKKDNIFNPNKNVWDIGWPCSPRKMVIYLFSFLVFIITMINLASCERADKVVLSKDGYNKLLNSNASKYPKPFELIGLDDLEASGNGIILGSDQHEYLMHRYGSKSQTLMHYVDCELCLSRKQQEREESFSFNH